METKIVNINTIKPNPNNPRLIKDDKFKKLVKSIKDFPEMLELREIIVDENMIILGGNMRYKALKELGIKEVPIKIANNLTEEQKKEFVMKDNISYGVFDWDIIANEWETDLLTEWGVDIPNWEGEEIDYSDKNKEIDTDEFSDNMTLKFEYNQNEYTYITENLNRINPNKELALLKLLNYES